MTLTPNILWIVTTQWRAQAFGYAGDPNLRGRTPHIDALAGDPRTINFAQAVTPHPFGPFARAAMLTGVPSPENGIRDYYDPLPTNSRTLAHELRERHGYATAFFGKWHLARRDPQAPLVGEAHARMIVPPEARGGFEFWEGFESGFLLDDPWLHGTRLPEPRQFPGYQSDILCDRALEYLRGQTETAPQFCVVSLEAPHPPYGAPLGVAPESIQLAKNVPLGGDAEAQTRRELAGYYAHIQKTDTSIGRLVAGVRAFAPDTLVVFTSVHGDMHGAHGLFRKGWPHEESVRVPLLVNVPEPWSAVAEAEGRRHRFVQGKISGHRESLKAVSPLRSATALQGSGIDNSAISLVDLFAMTRFFVAQTSSLHSGQADWKSALQKTAAHISMPSVVRLPHQCDRAWRGVRTPSRKLILNEDGSPWLFFDLENDPLEMCNLAANPAHADEVAALRLLIPASASPA